jgi:hypothetical protein
VYFGLSVGLQLLDVAFFTLALLRNHFTGCTVLSSGGGAGGFYGGNVYGGGVSVYMGGYSASFNRSGSAAAAVGDTAVLNSSVRVDAVAFTSCSASRVNSAVGLGNGNAYGGSLSLYLGGYAWSLSGGSSSSSSSSSNSTSGSTTASGVRVSISDVNSSDCSANTRSAFGVNSYGGSMSVYMGTYAWSMSPSSSSFSICGTTDVSGLAVQISSSRLANSSAVSYSRTFSQCPLVSIPLT